MKVPKMQELPAAQYVNSSSPMKHLSLAEAIDELEHVEIRLLELMERITNCGRLRKDVIGEGDEKQPSLQQVLNVAPHQIRDHITTCNSLIDEINMALFTIEEVPQANH